MEATAQDKLAFLYVALAWKKPVALREIGRVLACSRREVYEVARELEMSGSVRTLSKSKSVVVEDRKTAFEALAQLTPHGRRRIVKSLLGRVDLSSHSNICAIARAAAYASEFRIAASLLEQAGDLALSRGNYSVAIADYDGTLKLCESIPTKALPVALKRANALSSDSQGDSAFDAMLSIFERALELRIDDVLVAVTAKITSEAWRLGRCSKGLEIVDRLRQVLNWDANRSFTLLISHSHLLASTGRASEALDVLDSAASYRDQTTVDDFTSYLEARAFALTQQGYATEALDAYKQAAALARHRDDTSVRCKTLNNFAVASRDFGDVNRALELHAEARRFATVSHVEWRTRFYLLSHGFSLYVAGRLHEARSLFDKAVTKRAENWQAMSLQAVVAILIGVATDDAQLVERFYRDDLIDAACNSKEPYRINAMAAAIHGYHLYTGQAKKAEAVLNRAIALVDAAGSSSLLFTAVALYGDLPTVETAVAKSTPFASRSVAHKGYDLLLRSRLLHLQGQPEASLLSADRASQLFEDMSLPLHQGAALELAGRLGEAAKLYTRCGALTQLKRVRGRRWSVGRPRRVNGQLTTRELEVAKLCAAALRNREVAERLGVTVGTVEFHMSNIMRELGLSSRHEIRAAIGLD